MMVVNTQCSGLWRTPYMYEGAFNILVEKRRLVFAFLCKQCLIVRLFILLSDFQMTAIYKKYHNKNYKKTYF